MIKNDNLIQVNRETVAPDIYGKDQAKETLGLKHMIKLEGRCNNVRSVNVTSDNRYLIITYENSMPRIRILDLEKLEFLPHDYPGHTDSVRLTSITRDNKAFYTASWDGSSRRFEIESGKCTRIFSGFGRSPACYIDPDQKFLFTASYDSDCDIDSGNAGRCWDLATGRIIRVYKHSSERIIPEAIDIAYDRSRVFTGSDDGHAYQWDLEKGEPVKEYFSFEGSVRKLDLSVNYLAAACTDGLVRVHFKFSGEYFRYFSHTEKDVRSVRISKDETKLWSATDNGSVSCFNLITGELIYNRRVHLLWIWSLGLMYDEKILITGSGDGSVAFLAADSGMVLARLHNLPRIDDFLITCPPDKTFPEGFFYTSNKSIIQVFLEDRETQIRKKLEADDPRREAYINKLNLRNLIIARLKNNRYYDSLTENYLQHKKIFNQINEQKTQRMLQT